MFKELSVVLFLLSSVTITNALDTKSHCSVDADCSRIAYDVTFYCCGVPGDQFCCNLQTTYQCSTDADCEAYDSLLKCSCEEGGFNGRVETCCLPERTQCEVDDDCQKYDAHLGCECGVYGEYYCCSAEGHPFTVYVLLIALIPSVNPLSWVL